MSWTQVWENLAMDLRQSDLPRCHFRQLLKTFLFGQWEHSTVWITLYLNSINFLIYLLNWKYLMPGSCYKWHVPMCLFAKKSGFPPSDIDNRRDTYLKGGVGFPCWHMISATILSASKFVRFMSSVIPSVHINIVHNRVSRNLTNRYITVFEKPLAS